MRKHVRNRQVYNPDLQVAFDWQTTLQYWCAVAHLHVTRKVPSTDLQHLEVEELFQVDHFLYP